MVRQLTADDLRALRLEGITDKTAVDSDDLLALLEELGLVGIDNGCNAAVIEHPDDAGLVIRITTPSDGWVPYALHAQDCDLAPRIEAIGYRDGVWFAIVERLSPLTADLAWVPEAISSAMEEFPQKMDREDFRRACELWPGLKEFAAECLYGAGDIDTESNIMLRGGQIVINDPYPARDPDEDDDQLALDWQIDPAPTPGLDGPF